MDHARAAKLLDVSAGKRTGITDRASRTLRLAILGAAVFANGCGRAEPLSHEPKVALRQATMLIPKGTTEEAATKRLALRGFQVSRLNGDRPDNHLLVATYANDRTTWLVGLVIVDHRVIASTVTVSTP